MQPDRSPPRRRTAHRLLGVALGSAFALGAAEIGLRAWNALLHPPIYALDRDLGWVHVPALDRTLTDENGRRVRLRFDANGLRKAPGGLGERAPRSVMFVGDSFTEGAQVEEDEAFVARIGSELAGVAMLNAGVGGYSTLQAVRTLAGRLPKEPSAMGPDVVVLVVYDNDFQDNLMPYFSGLGPRPFVRVRGGEVTVEDELDEASFGRFLMPAPAAFWCYEHSAIYRALHKTLFLPQHGRDLAATEHAERAALPPADQRLAMAWLLARAAALVRAAGSELVVAAIPTREAAAAAADPQHDWLAEQCRSLGAPFVSMVAPLHEAPTAAYFAKDIHLTAAGHAQVAKALLPLVRAALQRRG
jgi:lysophospholipase L1-like esterase